MYVYVYILFGRVTKCNKIYRDRKNSSFFTTCTFARNLKKKREKETNEKKKGRKKREEKRKERKGKKGKEKSG